MCALASASKAPGLCPIPNYMALWPAAIRTGSEMQFLFSVGRIDCERSPSLFISFLKQTQADLQVGTLLCSRSLFVRRGIWFVKGDGEVPRLGDVFTPGEATERKHFARTEKS